MRARALRAGGRRARARSVRQLGDHVGLLDVFVQCEQWDDAFAICRAKPALEDRVCLPYAAWLADRDRFDEARGAYQRAGKPSSRRMLEQSRETPCSSAGSATPGTATGS